MNRQGFSLIEALLTVIIVSVLMGIALPQFAPAVSRTAVRSAVSTFTARHSLAKTLAIRQGSEARLLVDVDASRFWVVVDTGTVDDPVWDTIGTTVDLTENRVVLKSTTSTFCFNSRGLSATGPGCPGAGAAISFTRGEYATTLRITPLGKILR